LGVIITKRFSGALVCLMVATVSAISVTANAKGASVHPHKHQRLQTSVKRRALNEALIDAAGVQNYDGNPQKVSLLIIAGARINAQSDLGRTALTQAVQNRHPRIVKFLLKHGADVNLCAKGNAEGSETGGNALGFALNLLPGDREIYLKDLKEKVKYGESQNFDQDTRWVASDVLIIRMLKKAGARKSVFPL